MTRAVVDANAIVSAAIGPAGNPARCLYAHVARAATVVDDPPAPPPVSRDPKDDYPIALARAAPAHVLVTGDADLLALALADVRIVSPREFLELLPP